MRRARGGAPGSAPVVAALLAVQVFFGLHYLAAKILLARVPPGAWATIRIVAGAALLAAATALMRKRWPAWGPDHARIALYALFGVVINQVCFVEGLARTAATHSSVINTSIPVATLLIAIVLGRERGTAAKGLAIALSLTGVAVLLAHSGAALSGGFVAGDLLTLANALSYSFFLVISKPILERHSSQSVTALLLIYGSIGIALYGAPSLARTDLASLPASWWGWAGFVIVFATAGAYLLNSWALKRVPSSTVALFIYVQPIIASTLAVLFLGERISPALVIAAALIFGGVFVALRAESPAPSAARRAPEGAGAGA